ncbi:MAG TPA: site-specific DNA-methyltransferase [Candidatus Sulfotelmatobacter sp.]|nr:site-specific DNA-methyltransferase [Candidatus Sulfotelmatobacter sp.]
MKTSLSSIINGDCREALKKLSPESISCVVTDPPYNYEFIGRNWDHDEIQRRMTRIQDSSTLIKNIPYGSGLAGGVRNQRWYERNRENVVQYIKWATEWSAQLMRVCKPGAVVAVFSSTRTLAHVQVALEDAGFYARDVLVYRRHSGIPKGLNVAKKLRKIGDENADEWNGWHTCLRNEWEAIVVVQKPLLNNYIETIEQFGLGPFKAILADGSFQSNILEGFSKGKDEEFDEHCTIKPLSLIRKLIELFLPQNGQHTVLDPFAGTGTTLIAAMELGHRAVGIEIEQRYCAVIQKRLQESLFTAHQTTQETVGTHVV